MNLRVFQAGLYFLAAATVTFSLSQGCGQSFKLATDDDLTKSTSIDPGPMEPIILPLTIEGSTAFAGKARLARTDSGSLLPFTESTDTVVRGSVSSLFQRLITKSPKFDSNLSWYSNAWAHLSVGGIAVSEATGRPESWFLKDANGQRLYVDSATFAADLRDPGYRQHLINQLTSLKQAKYRGLLLDDLNMNLKVYSAQGSLAVATDGTQALSVMAWKSSMAGFVASVRMDFPQFEIAHSSNWESDAANNYQSPEFSQTLASSDVQLIEMGAIDPELTSGTVGQKTVDRLVAFANRVQAAGKGLGIGRGAMGGSGTLAVDRETTLAVYHLINNGRTFLIDNDLIPGSAFAPYDFDLGPPQSLPTKQAGSVVWERRFQRGIVYYIEPVGATFTLQTTGLVNLQGQAGPFSLRGGQGIILRFP